MCCQCVCACVRACVCVISKFYLHDSRRLWYSHRSTVVTDNPHYIRRRFFCNHPRCVRQRKQTENRLNLDGTLFFFFFPPGTDAPHVYVRAWTLCCSHHLISTHTFGGALPTASVESCPFNGVTNSVRVWRKVPYSDARSHTPSIAFRHPPPTSARFSYATKGVLFISAQLSSDAVSALRKVRVLI